MGWWRVACVQLSRDSWHRCYAGCYVPHVIGRSPVRVAVRVALMMAVAHIWSCGPSRTQFAGLRTGMDKAQVVALLGEPSSRYEAIEASASGPAREERWQFGDNLSSLATSATFADQDAPANVWVVYFGPDGRVSRWRPPEWER